MLGGDGSAEHPVRHDDVGKPGLLEREALAVGAVVGLEVQRRSPGLQPDRVEDVRELDPLPMHAGNPPARDALEGLDEGGGRHRFEIVDRERDRTLHQSADLETVGVAAHLGVRARDRVDAEMVAAGQQAGESRSEDVAEEVRDARAHDDPYRTECREAQEHPSPYGDSARLLTGNRLFTAARHAGSL